MKNLALPPSLQGMDEITNHIARIFNDPLPLLRSIFYLAKDHLIHLGMDKAATNKLHTLSKLYHGKTKHPQMRAKTLAAIADNDLPYAALAIMETRARTIRGQGAKWSFRLFMARLKYRRKRTQGLNLEEFTQAAYEEAERRSSAERAPKNPLRITRRAASDWSLTLTGEKNAVSLLYEALRELDDPIGKFLNAGRVKKILRPVVVIPLAEVTTVLDGTNDETVFRCSDGITKTSRELAAAELDSEWGFALLHPVKGPVDLLRSQRFANDKQRTLAMVENPTCAWDGCRMPADECQVHHIHSWAHGGQTNMSNLATCCRYHNGINDDDPHAPTVYGRLERVDGKVQRIFRP